MSLGQKSRNEQFKYLHQGCTFSFVLNWEPSEIWEPCYADDSDELNIVSYRTGLHVYRLDLTATQISNVISSTPPLISTFFMGLSVV